MKRFYLFVLVVSLAAGLSGQNRKTDTRVITEDMRYSVEKPFSTWSLSVGYGSLMMFSDISSSSIVPDYRLRFAPTVLLSKQLAPSLAIDMQYLHGEMYGENSPHYFKGTLNDFSLNGVFYINQLGAFPGPVRDRWNFVFKMGLGANFFRSKLHYLSNDAWVREDALGMPSTRYMVAGYDPYNPEEKVEHQMELVVPVGLGVQYRINRHFDVGLESTMRFSTADNLDNVLAGSTNDRYMYTGINLTYKVGRKDVRHMRWTYRGQGFNLFGRSRRDPLEAEVQMLEEAIQKYADRAPVQRDSVVVSYGLVEVYEAVSVRSLFFEPGARLDLGMAEQVLMAETVVDMKQNPTAALALYGYVDPDDTGDHEVLSARQCEQVLDFLVNELGADPERIAVFPQGAQGTFSGAEGKRSQVVRSANRRVDMVFKK